MAANRLVLLLNASQRERRMFCGARLEHGPHWRGSIRATELQWFEPTELGEHKGHRCPYWLAEAFVAWKHWALAGVDMAEAKADEASSRRYKARRGAMGYKARRRRYPIVDPVASHVLNAPYVLFFYIDSFFLDYLKQH
jgi:hypothetical protein